MSGKIRHIDPVNTEGIRAVLAEVFDPEVPVLSIIDLGILREIRVTEAGAEVVITPTYSGCPAMDMIRTNIRIALMTAGYPDVKITTVLSPAWTTDWMTQAGKDKLKAFGIAAPTPVQQVCHAAMFHRDEAIACPRCNSLHTTLISEFGSTSCKALYRCEDCKEPFDYFKAH